MYSKWKMCKKGKLPDHAVLGVDKKSNYLYGIIFEEPESSTGFVMTSSDECEIECVAYQEIKPKKMWKNLDGKLPLHPVFCISATGHKLIGVLTTVEDGVIVAENTEEVVGNIVGWYELDSYKDAVQKTRIFIYKAFPVAAIFFLGMIGNELIVNSPSHVEIASAQMAPALQYTMHETCNKVVSSPRDMVTTDGFMHSDELMEEATTIEINYDGYCYREDFNDRASYYDNKGRYHYISDNGRHFVMADEHLMIFDEEHQSYWTTSDYFITFLNTVQPASVINEMAKYTSSKIYIKYGDAVFEEPLMEHHLWIQDDGEIWYLGYDGLAFHVLDGELTVENIKNPDAPIQTYTDFSIKFKSEENTFDLWGNPM